MEITEHGDEKGRGEGCCQGATVTSSEDVGWGQGMLQGCKHLVECESVHGAEAGDEGTDYLGVVWWQSCRIDQAGEKEGRGNGEEGSTTVVKLADSLLEWQAAWISRRILVHDESGAREKG